MQSEFEEEGGAVFVEEVLGLVDVACGFFVVVFFGGGGGVGVGVGSDCGRCGGYFNCSLKQKGMGGVVFIAHSGETVWEIRLCVEIREKKVWGCQR